MNNYTALYTVGFYDPDGKFQSESDWNCTSKAAQRVHYLNGGTHSVSTAIERDAGG